MAEVELKKKMLSRLSIFPPYQGKGYEITEPTMFLMRRK